MAAARHIVTFAFDWLRGVLLLSVGLVGMMALAVVVSVVYSMGG